MLIIVSRVRQGKFGTRLLAKLAFIFALVGVVPGAIIYVVSYQFVSRSIESWFDVNVETALTSGLNLGRGMLDASLSDLQNKGRLMSDQLASADPSSLTLTLLRLRDQFSVQDATIVEPHAQRVGGTAPDVRVVAQASSNFSALVPDNLPTPLMINQARDRPYGAIEGEVDGDPDATGPKGALRLRVIVKIPDPNDHRIAARRTLPADRAAGEPGARAQRGRRAARVSRVSGEARSGAPACARCISAR